MPTLLSLVTWGLAKCKTVRFLSSISPASDAYDQILHSVELTNPRGALFRGKISSVDRYRRLWVSVANRREDAGYQLVVNANASGSCCLEAATFKTSQKHLRSIKYCIQGETWLCIQTDYTPSSAVVESNWVRHFILRLNVLIHYLSVRLLFSNLKIQTSYIVI